MPPTSSPHALLLLLATLLLAASASPVSGEMVIGHAARTAGGETVMWHQRRLEDAVAPEFPSAAQGGGINYSPLIPQQQQCIRNCAAKGPGSSYTRPCLAVYHCP